MAKLDLADGKTTVIIAVNDEKPIFVSPVKMTQDEIN